MKKKRLPGGKKKKQKTKCIYAQVGSRGSYIFSLRLTFNGTDGGMISRAQYRLAIRTTAAASCCTHKQQLDSHKQKAKQKNYTDKKEITIQKKITKRVGWERSEISFFGGDMESQKNLQQKNMKEEYLVEIHCTTGCLIVCVLAYYYFKKGIFFSM